MLESIIDTSRCGAPKSRWPRRVDWKLQRARGATTPLPRLALHPRRAACAGAHVTPMAPQAGATALRPLAASRLVGACRGRPTAHEGVATATTFLPSFPVRRGVSRRPPARPTTTRVALFSLPLSLSLSISFSPPIPNPVIPAPSFTVNFSFFFPAVGASFPTPSRFSELPAFAGVAEHVARATSVCRDRGGVLPLARTLCYRATTRPASRVRLEYGPG